VHYRLESCWSHFLVLDLSWLPMYLSGNWGRMNNGRPCHSMERRLSTHWDDNLGSGHHTDWCRLCIIRHRGNSTRRLRLGTTTFSLEDKNIIQSDYREASKTSNLR